MPLSLPRLLLGLLAWIAWGAPVFAQTCQATVEPVLFQVYNASAPIHMAVNTRAAVTCSQGRPGTSLRVCLLSRQTALSGDATVLFTDPGAAVTFDARGQSAASIETRAQLIGRVQGANGQRMVRPVAEFLAVSLVDKGAPCVPIAAAAVPVSGMLSFAFSDICSAGVDSAMDFGTIDTKAARVLGQARIWALCTAGTAYQIYLYSLLANAENPAQRKMTNGAQSILYGIYKDANCAQPWGWTRDVDTVAAVGNGDLQRYTVFGCIFPKGQSIAPGTYKDTISVTIAY
ncbi:hypothetical protein GCM10007036_10230 [Alsobacter metallidurans]|uniref:Spore coat protein U/FanG domain-containing protein n=1 Tax=Alsobacter metallidurans TaxID=340221 RepID=A0A917MG25_9HYPH|nr:spore coat U domain-containing protein [Alsobacter metallidurans]GGH12423.1 hypothetical protein GCM10007036_10230 [Alsobacter metallidurans]